MGPIVAVRQTQLAESEGAARQAAENINLALQRRSDELAAQLRLSTVLRLATQAQEIGKDWPVLSVLLAVEAVETTRRHDGTTIPIAHESLLTATANLGGWPHTGANR